MGDASAHTPHSNAEGQITNPRLRGGGCVGARRATRLAWLASILRLRLRSGELGPDPVSASWGFPRGRSSNSAHTELAGVAGASLTVNRDQVHAEACRVVNCSDEHMQRLNVLRGHWRVVRIIVQCCCGPELDD